MNKLEKSMIEAIIVDKISQRYRNFHCHLCIFKETTQNISHNISQYFFYFCVIGMVTFLYEKNSHFN